MWMKKNKLKTYNHLVVANTTTGIIHCLGCHMDDDLTNITMFSNELSIGDFFKYKIDTSLHSGLIKQILIDLAG